jgi:hypothetical protein
VINERSHHLREPGAARTSGAKDPNDVLWPYDTRALITALKPLYPKPLTGDAVPDPRQILPDNSLYPNLEPLFVSEGLLKLSRSFKHGVTLSRSTVAGSGYPHRALGLSSKSLYQNLV